MVIKNKGCVYCKFLESKSYSVFSCEHPKNIYLIKRTDWYVVEVKLLPKQPQELNANNECKFFNKSY